ncbi:hypothetical protein HBB16_00955 [Pseudonocardia sp. MCCB 268]|nr:hypothetical protein [Pseudonocardia cytotoxica]
MPRAPSSSSPSAVTDRRRASHTIAARLRPGSPGGTAPHSQLRPHLLGEQAHPAEHLPPAVAGCRGVEPAEVLSIPFVVVCLT